MEDITLPCLVAIRPEKVEATCLICYVTSKELVTEVSCDFMSGNSFLYVITVLRLMARGTVLVEI